MRKENVVYGTRFEYEVHNWDVVDLLKSKGIQSCLLPKINSFSG